jgi:hypothetical protein
MPPFASIVQVNEDTPTVEYAPMSYAAASPITGTRAAVHYVSPSRQPLYCYDSAPSNGLPESNVTFEEHLIHISDARGIDRPLALNSDGAALISQRSRVTSFDDERAVRDHYYAEAADIIRSVTGADDVVVFDHNIRRGGTASSGGRRPVYHAHADFTAASALRRAAQVMGPKAQSARRLVSINLWRPIAEPVRDSPLAICASTSVTPEDLVPAELRYEHRTGEIYYLGYNPRHRWLYAPEMRMSEFWLFKNSDSSVACPARVTPHSAFIDAAAPSSIPPRESIEVRAFALFE